MPTVRKIQKPDLSALLQNEHLQITKFCGMLTSAGISYGHVFSNTEIKISIERGGWADFIFNKQDGKLKDVEVLL